MSIRQNLRIATMVRAATAAGFVLMATLNIAATTEAQPADRPNVVLVTIDSLRADRLGAYGYTERPTSPNIDALASESVVFEDASAAAPWTLPSVASLLTSTFTLEHKAIHDRVRLGDQFSPLPERLQKAGYNTLGLYANEYAGPGYGCDRGFVAYEEAQQIGASEIAPLLGLHPAGPLFLYIHANEPRLPKRYAPLKVAGFPEVDPLERKAINSSIRKFKQLSRADFDAKNPLGTTDSTEEQGGLLDQVNQLRQGADALYDLAVWEADKQVGQVISTLKQLGLWDNTLFILLSSNGVELGERGGWQSGQSAYEELLHVPLVIHFPNNANAGKRVETAVSLVDVLPTIADFLGNPELATGARGHSLLPMIRGEAPEPFRVTAMRTERMEYYEPWAEARGATSIVVRHGHWKGIWNMGPDTIELYDLADDPAELRDVSDENPDLAVAMNAYARVWYKNTRHLNASPPAPVIGEDDEAAAEEEDAQGPVRKRRQKKTISNRPKSGGIVGSEDD